MTIVTGNGGNVFINDDGTVRTFDPSYETDAGEHEGYADILRFDVDEYRRHYKCKDLPTAIDILTIGYWHKGGYEPPEPEFRRPVIHASVGDTIPVYLDEPVTIRHKLNVERDAEVEHDLAKAGVTAPAKKKFTVICRDNGNTRHGYEAVLIYTIEVADINDTDAVIDEIIEWRASEVDNVDEDDIELLFAYEGDLKAVADWRE
jgi:hypothetical protein